jgi:hypothetical protein
MSEEKNIFQKQIKEYINIEDEIEQLNAKMKLLREKKQNVHQTISNTIVKNQWMNKNIQMDNYKLCMVEKKQYSSITFSYLEETLHKIIPDENELKYLMKYLKDNRSIKHINELRYVKK